ncbi:MAG: serine/threonine-protein kinase [Candidatus Melainabacteria bacterium]|nr:serine/threonine-protein kinase [Candidatus Melainabacteria bacterium]
MTRAEILAKDKKYPVISPSQIANPEDVILRSLMALFFSGLLWIVFSAAVNFQVVPQTIFFGAIVLYAFARHGPNHSFVRAKLQLKAKGLDIKSPTLKTIMPWNWLTKVEIRHRSFDFIPNYVYFEFKNKSDVLILWEDVRDDMDQTTLISCVRTWAPHAEIRGDASIAKAESMATYTELWLKDLSSAKSESRHRKGEVIENGAVLFESYKVEKLLSGGGQGTAYLASVLPHADFADMPPQVVIKEFILPQNERGMQKARESLNKEVTILRRIDHPRIIRLYDFFIEDMRGYLVIEYVDGLTFRQFVEKNGLPTESSVAEMAISLCKTISYLHQLSPSIIHGDVTPDNIIIEKDGGVKLLDFDAAQELTRNKTNTVVGKHSYMSPEQFKGMLSESSDVYALGCTLHFLLTGFDPEPISESFPKKINDTVSDAINEIVSKATRLDQSNRFLNLDAMRAQLEQL